MKMKGLLLGTAAGIVAVSGAQAADLPVKAKPVEYVKVCSAYGAGFYYIPGTDICLRVGGYIWSEFEVNDFGSAPDTVPGQIGGDFVRNRNDDLTSFRWKFDWIMDARTNTEYGTLRSYASLGMQWTTNLDGFQQIQQPASTGNYSFFYERAFIQFAGLTFGYVGSFFDFDPQMSINTLITKSFVFTPAIAYTAQFGNGISASISMEDSTTRRMAMTSAINSTLNGTVYANGIGYYAPFAAVAGGCSAANATLCGNDIVVIGIAQAGWNGTLYGGQSMPDFVANLRVDQAWGDAQISGAVHQLRPAIAGAAAFVDAVGGGTPGGVPWASTKYGYAALAGLNFKLPMLGAGDSWQIEGAWAKGATDYAGSAANPYSNALNQGYRKGFYGPVIEYFDSYINANGQALSTAWSIDTELRHFWTPAIRSVVRYGHFAFNAPAAAQNPANVQGTVASNAPNGFIANFPSGKVDVVTLGVTWSPVPKLDLGLEGYWERMSTDCGGLSAANCSNINEATRGKSADFFGGLMRARRDF
jgi:hypothetical protein